MKLNKKQIGLIAGLAAVILLIVLLLTMCNGGGNGDRQGETTAPSASVETAAPTAEGTSEPAEETEPTEESTEATEETTEPTEETTEPTTGGNTKPGGTSGYNPGGSGSGSGGNTDDSTGTDTTPKAPAAGSAESPYVEVLAGLPDSVSSVAISSDSTVYHNVFGVEEGVLTIQDSEAYVIYNGATYEPDENGLILVPVAAAAAEETPDEETGEDTETVVEILPVSFQLGSKSAEAKSFLLQFNAPLGTLENPQAVEAEDGVLTLNAKLEAGDEDGYYFSHTAVNSGTLTLQLDSVTEDVICDVIVTIGENTYKLSEAEEGLLTVNMAQGDEVLIQVVALPGEDGTIPAAEVTVTGQIEDAPGTKGNPIVIFGEFPIVTDVLEPGTEVYYSVYGANGMILNLADPDAYVTVGEETWNPVDGVITGEVVTSNPREPALIAVGNNGETAESYTVDFTYKVGTMQNPGQLLIDQTNTVVIPENAMDGYWYAWTAVEDGTLIMAMPEGNWMYLVNNVTSSVYGDTQYSDSDPVVNVAEIPVAAGDTLNIFISTYNPEEPWAIPAGEIAFDVVFAPLNGTKDNPVWLTELVNTTSVAPTAPMYYNIVFSGVDMVVTGEGTFTVTCDGINYPAQDGVVTVTGLNASRYEPVPMIITNYGTEKAEYTIEFIYPIGSSFNPEIIEVMGQYTAPVIGDGEGYFYNWTATANGEFSVTMLGTDWSYVVNNLTSYIYGEQQVSSDGGKVTETITVAAGDLISINVSTASRQDKDVVLEVDFYDPTYGTEENPIWLTALENTVTVRPGSTVYCNAVLSGVTMTVTGAEEFSLTCNGIEYTSENGVITIHGINGSRFTPVQLTLTNPGETKAEYSVVFAYPLGSSANPEVIGEMGNYTAAVVGDGEGYFYTWTAPADGVFTIDMLGNDWNYVVNNLTSYIYGEIRTSSADSGSEVFEVKTGDELQINVGTASRQNRNVEIVFDYYDPNYGTQENPIWLTGMENTVTVRPGTEVYGTVVFGGVTMTIQGDGDYAVTLGGVGYPVIDGAVTIPNVNASRMMPLELILTTSGDQKVDCTVSFAYPQGSSANPHILGEMGSYSVNVVGDGEGYFFTWYATADGQFTVSMLGDDWVYVVNNLTSYSYGGIRSSESSDPASSTIAVKEGDEIQINIGTASRQNKSMELAFAFEEAPLVFAGSYTPKTFELDLEEIAEMGMVALTERYEMESSKAGIYHLGDMESPLVLIDFTDDTYVNLKELVESMDITIEVTGEDGTVTTQHCNELLEQYIACAWEQEVTEDITRTLYPLTEDLELILKSLGQQLGWFDPDSEGYLFGELELILQQEEEPAELQEDSLWMFACSYVQFRTEETPAVTEETVAILPEQETLEESAEESTEEIA